jgi:MoaA/NifB/PqqE/SkfB family radical SAM enzyme
MSHALPSWSHLYKRVYEGVNYRLRTVAQGRLARHCRPASIALLMTDRCNAKCVHCDIWKNRGQEQSPTVEQWKKVLDDLRDWLGPVHVVFTGGEALLRAWSPELAAYGSARGLFVEFLTHGFWEDQTRIEQLGRANPWRITISLDGIGETHSLIRGKAGFFEKTRKSIDTLMRLRREEGLQYTIRLKTVVMSHNLERVREVAEFAATQDKTEVFYQAVEQNYNTPEDPRWFETSPTWPGDPEQAVAAVQRLIASKRAGLPIANSFDQLEAMVPYFRNPDASRIQIQSHSAHERKALCAALVTLQIGAGGDVIACYGMPAIGNIKETPIRELWEQRPRWWDGGCCMERRCSEAEKQKIELIGIS